MYYLSITYVNTCYIRLLTVNTYVNTSYIRLLTVNTYVNTSYTRLLTVPGATRRVTTELFVLQTAAVTKYISTYNCTFE